MEKERSSHFLHVVFLYFTFFRKRQSHIIIHIFFLQLKIYNIIIYYYNSYNMRWTYWKGIVYLQLNNIHGFEDMLLDWKTRRLNRPHVIPTITDSSHFSVQYLMFTCGSAVIVLFSTVGKMLVRSTALLSRLLYLSAKTRIWKIYKFCCEGRTFENQLEFSVLALDLI